VFVSVWLCTCVRVCVCEARLTSSCACARAHCAITMQCFFLNELWIGCPALVALWHTKLKDLPEDLCCRKQKGLETNGRASTVSVRVCVCVLCLLVCVRAVCVCVRDPLFP